MERGFFDWIAYILQKYGPDILKGAGTTMLIAVVATVAGFAIGLVIGCIRTICYRCFCITASVFASCFFGTGITDTFF